MEKTLHDLQLPMDIADECMLQREKRTDIDQVHDEVEKCLTKVRTDTIHCLHLGLYSEMRTAS